MIKLRRSWRRYSAWHLNMNELMDRFEWNLNPSHSSIIKISESIDPLDLSTLICRTKFTEKFFVRFQKATFGPLSKSSRTRMMRFGFLTITVMMTIFLASIGQCFMSGRSCSTNNFGKVQRIDGRRNFKILIVGGCDWTTFSQID